MCLGCGFGLILGGVCWSGAGPPNTRANGSSPSLMGLAGGSAALGSGLGAAAAARGCGGASSGLRGAGGGAAAETAGAPRAAATATLGRGSGGETAVRALAATDETAPARGAAVVAFAPRVPCARRVSPTPIPMGTAMTTPSTQATAAARRGVASARAARASNLERRAGIEPFRFARGDAATRGAERGRPRGSAPDQPPDGNAARRAAPDRRSWQGSVLDRGRRGLAVHPSATAARTVAPCRASELPARAPRAARSPAWCWAAATGFAPCPLRQTRPHPHSLGWSRPRDLEAPSQSDAAPPRA